MAVIHLSDENFKEEVIDKSKEKPVVVCASALEWCQPCKYFFPIFTSVSNRMDSKIVFAELDIDTCLDSATRHLAGLRGVPALFLWKNSKIVSTKVGAQSESDFVKWLEKEVN